MKKIVTRFGIGLSAFAFITLMIFIVLPALTPLDNLPLVKNAIQALFCKSGETLSSSTSTYETPGVTTQSTDLQCVNNEGQGRDVSDNFIQAAFIGYLVTFLGGIAIVGVAQYFPTPQARPTPAPADSFHENYAAETHRHEPTSAGTSSDTSLTRRLTDLKNALDAGLITQAEFDTKHKELLKEA